MISFLLLLSSFVQANSTSPAENFALIVGSLISQQASQSANMEELANQMLLSPEDLRDFLADLKDQKHLDLAPPRIILDGTNMHIQFPHTEESIIQLGPIGAGVIVIDGQKISLLKSVPYRQAKYLLKNRPPPKNVTGLWPTLLLSHLAEAARDITSVLNETADAFRAGVWKDINNMNAIQIEEDPEFLHLGDSDSPEKALINGYRIEFKKFKKRPSIQLTTFECVGNRLSKMATWYPVWNGQRQDRPLKVDQLEYHFSSQKYEYRDAKNALLRTTDKNGKILWTSKNDYAVIGHSVFGESPFNAVPQLAQHCCETPKCADNVKKAVEKIEAYFVKADARGDANTGKK